MDEQLKERVLYEKNIPHKGKWGFYRKNGSVCFDYDCLFDEGEWDTFHGEYSLIMFIQEIQKLSKEGKATLVNDTSRLEIIVVSPKKVGINFQDNHRSLYLHEVDFDPSRFNIAQ